MALCWKYWRPCISFFQSVMPVFQGLSTGRPSHTKTEGEGIGKRPPMDDCTPMASLMKPPLNSSASVYRVGWLVDDAGSVAQDVTVRFHANGQLDVLRGGDPATIDLGAVALVPGLVNAHTHLEFSLLREPIPTTGRFTDWIRSVVKYRREQAEPFPVNRVPEAIRAGVEESVRCGTALMGDIATTGWSSRDYSTTDFAGVVFQELIGLGDERVGLQTALARHVMSWAGHFGLSPHALYSVRPDLLKSAVALARTAARPVAMHLAETEAELELLADGTGEFRELLTEFGIWRDGLFGGARPLTWLETLAAAPRSLIVHGNYFVEDELQFLAARPHMTLVYCPRTHAAFGHRHHPWRRLLELGGSVAFGTDSRASNPDLSLFAELQFVAKQHPDLSHLTLLDLATRGGRRALRGDVDAERSTDFTLIKLASPHAGDLTCDLFAPSSQVVGLLRGARPIVLKAPDEVGL